MGKHLERADILLDLDKYDLAEQELRQEIAENPDSDLAHGSLARCLINQRRVGSETLEIIKYALSLNPENDWLHYLLAIYWHIKCDFNQAQQAIGIAIELDPNCAQYFDALARILFDRGNDRFNTHSWRVLAIIFVISRGALWPIGWGISAIFKSYWLRSYLQPAVIPLQRSLALDPGCLSAINLQTQLLIETNRWHPALASSLNALEIDPNNGIAHKLHAQILLRLGKYTAAVDHLQSALRIKPDDEDSKVGLLEAIRSQYWIYPWISITNWRGRLVLSIGFVIAVVMGISTIWFTSENASVFFICLIFTPFVCISIAAKPIFNLFLQLSPRNKRLMFSSISVQQIIFGNYIASLIIAIISLTYFFSGLSVILNNELILAITIPTLLMTAGMFISTVTFLPTITHQRSLSLSLIYQLIVRGVGVGSLIVLYLGASQVGTLYSIFFWLVILSPVAAIYTSKYTHR